MMKIRTFAWAAVASALLFAAAGPAAAETLQLERIPQRLDPSLEHLLSLVEPGSTTRFSPPLAGPVIDFVLSKKAGPLLYHMGERQGGQSSYHDFRVKRSFEDVLKLTYTPDIPSYLTTPSSVRLSYWMEVNGKAQPFPRLWTQFDKLSEPIRVDGLEVVVNTPDMHTGVYYAYLLDRTLLLMRHNGKKVLISLAKQRGPSEVGKKGMVLGPDEDWNYLYTDETGLSIMGLGWVESYMYDSSSILVFAETDGPDPGVAIGVFKWLRAGWAGINMAQPHHIYNGLERFALAFKSIVEADQLPGPDALALRFARIEKLPLEDLREQSREYYDRLKEKFAGSSRMSQQWFESAFGKDGHLDRMGRKELESVLCIATIRSLLGKDRAIDIGYLRPRTVQPRSGG